MDWEIIFFNPFFLIINNLKIEKMKKIYALLLISCSCISFAQQQTVVSSIAPNPFEETNSITITVQGSSINEAQWGVTDNSLFLWAWSYDIDDMNLISCPTNGVDFANSSLTNKFTYNSGPDTYTYTFVPTSFFNRTSIGRIGYLIKAQNGTGDKKSQDIFSEVGLFGVTLVSPATNSTTILSSGSNLSISANNTNGNANYVLKSNGNPTPITTVNNVSSFLYNATNITSNQNYQLEITQGAVTQTRKFTVIINPGIISQALPSSTLVDGINYTLGDDSKVTLVLTAPLKDFVYVAGSFNSWQPTSAYAMKKDPSTGKFWLEITGLVPGVSNSYQYWVCDLINRPANSPALVKTADPYSKLILSPFDDPEIITLGVYPGLPTYPAGQEREVTVLQTGSTAYYNYTWSAATTNFVKPKKKDLVIYEVLVRDFDATRTFQDLINKIDYFKNLKVNAIQLMPVMEFEGNESWGYNTAYHLALDKRYGSPAKLKEFIDLCHQNGIAIILDVALNHVFGRSPLERMWMLDTDNDGWGNGTTTENPYINQFATHAYGVGSDLNHFRTTGPGANMTANYVAATLKTWIQDYKIDGFRWDLTKGFTNECTSGDESCTNGYHADRVAKMKAYADKQWEFDPSSYVIFEHLGTGGSASEETEWMNYNRSGDVGGIMQWRKMTDPYSDLLKGNSANLSGVSDSSDRAIGFAESHDEERIGYKAFNEVGQTQGNLAKIHQRLPAIGAVHLLVPGPKMIWHFGELGWEKSLWTCGNGTVSYNSPDCKLDTKPQPQWVGAGWQANVARQKIYTDWARMIDLKKSEPVFENGSFGWNFSSTGHPRLDVFTSTSPSSSLSYVVVFTNFTDNSYIFTSDFPYTGSWTNLMDNSVTNVGATNMMLTIEPGGFRVFGNNPSLLSNTSFTSNKSISIYPNPATNSFSLDNSVSKVQIYSVTGQLVKSFKGDFEADHSYSIEDLNKGIYIVKAFDNDLNEKSLKLIKN